MIDRARFDNLWEKGAPNQNKEEWFRFLSVVQGIIQERGIENPVVIEVGVHTQCQRLYYEQFLGAEWIGIDISDEYSKPTIKGDSSAPETIEALSRFLSGRSADIIFIDGDHSFDAVCRDYAAYNPFARHIIAFHDVRSIAGPGRLFEEIIDGSTSDRKMTFLRIECWNTHTYRYGIGLIIKGE